MRKLLTLAIFIFLFIGPYAQGLPSTVLPPINGDDAGDMYAVSNT